MKYCGSGLTMEASLPHETASGAPQTTVPSEWLDECLDEPKSEIKYCEQKERKLRNASKPHSTPRTLKWLEENYELAEGVCIPRSTLYVHYLDYCEKTDTQPVNAASFGKIIRQQFQHITTRRLGTRGQSKYHYYGIGIKDNSIYYELMYSKNGVQNNQDGRKDAGIKPIVAYSPRSKLGTLLPEFPDIAELKLPQSVAEDKVRTFVMMYRTHCQRILDTVIRANFEEVQNFLLHFWQGMPSHIVPILGTPVVVNLVGVCDSILYKAVSGVLMPTVLQALPESLTQVIRKFAKQLDDWLRVALEGLPDALRHMKLDLARRFGQVLRRQTSLNHLCQAARTVLHSADIVAQMLDDWAAVDLASICKQTLYTMDSYSPREHQTIIALYKEFEQLLADSAPIEAYTEWLEAMVTRCVVRPAAVANAARQQCGGGSAVRRIARQFLLMWSCFGTRVIRDMTLHSAPSFGSFHLLHLMFDDYVLYLVEALHSEERVRDLLRIIRGEQTTSEEGDDLALPRPSFHGLDGSLSLPTSSPMMPGMERHSVITDTRDVYTHMGTYGPAGLPAHAHDNTSPTQSVNSYELQTTDELIQIGSPHGLATADSQSGNFAEYRYGVGRSDGTGYTYPYTQAQYQGYMGRSYNGRYNSEWDYSTMIGSNCQSDQLASGQSYEGFERGNSSYSLASYGSYDLRNSNQPVIWPDGSIAAGGYYESSENSNMANLHSQSRKRKSTSVDNVDNKRNASNIIDFQFDMATAYGNT